ncbi:MAG: DNA mismatch repair endonuclease MutL [Leptospiraceae bacterium]|nr:DNA mismatch repair endonuclease MutL [Leptospiraceae bacterium]MCP5497135.1 DNA mismatch repair endonuclease MutL [Leptospiraceae bacterium]
MGLIHELDVSLINKIAAGEVIESAHSVIKELLENSLDANATEIKVETKSGGIDLIVVSDNGDGISEDDLELSLKRHATSKIENIQDLESILTYGFRGEALASIASVSKLKISSSTGNSLYGVTLATECGKLLSKEITSAAKGTTISIEDLFYNTPVRRKFLKSEISENKKIKDRIYATAISKNDIGFFYIQDGKEVIKLKPEDKLDRIASVFGENLKNNLIEVQLEKKGIHCHGYISDPDFYRSNRSGQFIFVNDRPIEIKYSSYLLKKSYDELLPPGGHPWCFLFFHLEPNKIDVNVHPTKKEIRFLDEEGFNSFFLNLINAALRPNTPVGIFEKKHKIQNFQNFYKAKAAPTTIFQEVLHQDIYPKAQKQTEYQIPSPQDFSEESSKGVREKINQKPKFRKFFPKRHFGVIYETFILIESEDGFYIVDQHTAHERIRYEEVLNKYLLKSIDTQNLLTPIRMDLSLDESRELILLKDKLNKVGIVIDDLGGGTIIIREVPTFIDPGSEREVVFEFIEKLKLFEGKEPELYDTMAKSTACHSAIKKGDQLSDPILGDIIDKLSYCENPYRCPHGRPTLIKLTQEDLEKMFSRRK